MGAKRDYLRPDRIALGRLPPEGAAGQGDLCIVVPVIAAEPSAADRLSLATLRRYAGGERTILLHPEGLDTAAWPGGFERLAVPAAAMASLSAYNALLMSADFYRLFAGFGHMLIFQLDCLMLNASLRDWLALGHSYWGAPYFRRNGRFKAAGNGGLSLRKVADHIAVLQSRRAYLTNISGSMLRQYAKGVYLDLLARGLIAGAGQRFVGGFNRAEDEFWSFYAPLFSKTYSLGPPELAVGFAAESRPAHVAALNGGGAPMGAHAWAKHDRAFWVEQLRARGFGAELEALGD